MPRVISTIPISSKPSPAAVAPLAPAPAATAPAIDPPIASALDQHDAPTVPPPASGPVPVSASSELNETAAVAPVAREPGAPSPALVPPTAHGSIHPAARFGCGASTGFLGAEGRWRRLRRSRASRVRLRPLLPRRCPRQHLSCRPPIGRFARRKGAINRRSSSAQMVGANSPQQRPPALAETLRGMRRRHRPLVLLCRRVAGPVWRCPPAALTRFSCPPNAVPPRPTRPFGRSGPNSRTSLAGASRWCAALISVRRASTTAPWSAPLRQWKRRLECAAH